MEKGVNGEIPWTLLIMTSDGGVPTVVSTTTTVIIGWTVMTTFGGASKG